MIQTKKTPYSSHAIDTNKCVDNIGNRFDLILVASKRVRELSKGHRKHVDTYNSHAVTALREIEAGHIKREYLKKI